MAKQIRRIGRYMLVLGPLAVLVMLLVPMPEPALAAFTGSMNNVTPSMECFCVQDCPSCAGVAEWRAEGLNLDVNLRTGEARWDYLIGDVPGKTRDFPVGLLYRSYIDGDSQFGEGVLPSFELAVEKVIDNSGDPEGAYGHHVNVRYPSGYIGRHDWNGSAYVAAQCADTDVVTRPTGASGPYCVTDKHGAKCDLDSNGMPATWTDTNGNTMTASYNSSKQVTSITDWRGGTWSFSQNGSGYVSSITDPTSRTWSFGYSGDALTTITTPETTDQTGGITTTLGRDGSGRLTSVQDGRGNTVLSVAYVGSTGQVDSVTMDGDTVDYAYATGRVDRTDRSGSVHRTHYSGQIITQTDMWISSAAQFVTTYSYHSDNRLAYVVFARGNRIDYTWSSAGNLTERRHKTANTSSTSSSDIVHAWGYNSASFMTSYTDPLGNQTTYTRNAGGQITQVTHPTVTSPATQTASRSYTINSYGQVTQATDEEGKVTNYYYFTSGSNIHLLDRIEVDPSGVDAETSFGYDSWLNVSTVTDPRSAVTTRTYDSLRRLKQLDLPSSLGREKWEYDGAGNVTKHEVRNLDQDAAEVSSNPWWTNTFTYTVLNDLATITEEITTSVTRTTTLEYDDSQRRIRVIKPEGNKEKWEYNERGLVKKHIRGETSAVASDREFFYDANGNLSEAEDARNYDTTYTYDLFDRRTKSTNAQSAYTEWTLDKRGMATEVARKDSSNNVLLRQERFYDERGRLWKTEDLYKDPSATYSDAVTTITRLKTGHVSTVTDPRSKTTTYTYDGAWRRTKVTDHAGNERSWTLDDNGNPTAWSIKDEDGASDVTHNFEATYDAINRRLTTVEIDRTNSSNTYTTTNAYDSRSNLVWQVNAEGNPTKWFYDGLSRMTAKQVALAYGTPITSFTSYVQTQWGFDKNDRMNSHKDDAANETTWAFDALDRATSMTYPGGTQVVSYTYDLEDNVTQTLDSAGSDIDDTFDSLGRRTARAVTRATGFLDTTSETFTYDAADRLLTAEDNDYKVELTYGVLGLSSNVYEEKQSYATGTAYLKTVTRKYDAVGNKTYEAYPSGLTLGYVYTDVNQLDTISDGTNTLADYAYGGLRRKSLTYGNSAKTVYSYSGFRGEVATIDHQDNASSTILRLDYGYNKLHDRTYERYGASGSAGDAFEYDKARRLTVAWMGSSTPSSPSGNTYTKKIEYNMDDDGNRSSVVVTPYGQSPATTSYTDNAYNQYTVVGGVNRSHDANGNVTDDGTYTYAYNYKNLIVKATRKSDSVVVGEYKYDALGRRVEKVVSGATYRYIYSGVETVSVYTSTGTWKQDYVYGPVIDEVIMLEQADVLDWDADSNTTELARSWYMRNALGSVMLVEEPDRTEAVTYRYDPYGEIAITRGGSSQSSDPLGQYVTYTGRWRDEETGLYHYRARAYDPVRGRFLQRDPMGYVDGASLFAYVRNCPLSAKDPSGEKLRWEVRDSGNAHENEKASAEAKKAMEDLASVAGVKLETRETEDGVEVTGVKPIANNPNMASVFWLEALMWLINDHRTHELTFQPEYLVVDGVKEENVHSLAMDCPAGRWPQVGLGWSGWDLVWISIHELLHVYLYHTAYDDAVRALGEKATKEEKEAAGEEAGSKATADDKGESPPKGAVAAENKVREEVGHVSDPDPEKSEIRHHHKDAGAPVGPKPRAPK